jgi:uncharacterized protein
MPSGAYIMIIELLNKGELILLNKKLKYPLAIAEKDYFLALTSKVIFNSKIKDWLIFKGGTALHHVYLPQLRFSEDLDFSSNSKKINLEELKNIFTPYDFLEVKKGYVSGATVKIEKLQYTGPSNQPNSLKVEIDFLQNVVLPPLEIEYQNVYGIKTKVRVMDIREIAAEKIRAMNDRVRYRDFYDYAMIIKKLDINTKEVIGLVKRKEIRKIISKDNILENWHLAQAEKQEELSSIYYSEEIKNEEVEKEIKNLSFTEIK